MNSHPGVDASLPQGQALHWQPDVLWLNVLPDLAVAIACLAIAVALIRVSRRSQHLPFQGLLLWSALLTLAYGLSHVVSVWNVWHADYWLEGWVKVLVAAAAIPTAWLVWRATPHILSLPAPQQLQQANESLARANREMEAFTASVSHDLRSPLSSVAGQAGLLEISLGEQATDDQRRRLHRIQAGVKQMSELIEALLTLSRITRQPLQSEPVDVTALAQDIVADLRLQEPAREVNIAIQPDMTLRGDRRLIGTVLANLIGNAWKFTARTDRPQIDVGLTQADSQLTLHVRDNGAGFDMAYLEKLFKPFQRLHSPSEFPGSGIGLATVQRIIERHGGRVWARGKPQEGAAFYCVLPDDRRG